MTIDETKLILGELKGIYPARFRKMDYEQSEQMLRLWARHFDKVPFDLVRAAVDRYVRENRKGYAPEVSELLALVNQIRPAGAFCDDHAEAARIMRRQLGGETQPEKTVWELAVEQTLREGWFEPWMLEPFTRYADRAEYRNRKIDAMEMAHGYEQEDMT